MGVQKPFGHLSSANELRFGPESMTCDELALMAVKCMDCQNKIAKPLQDGVSATTNPMLNEALRLLKLGYRPLPIDPEKKHPWINWKKYQTEAPSEKDIRRWFKQRPDSGLGISTDGLIVVDVDGPDNPWHAKMNQVENLATVPHETTPGGGGHSFFRESELERFRCSANKIAAKVDIRTDGGFVVVSPTTRSDGKSYQWSKGRKLDCSPDLLPLPPQWLIEELRKVASKSKASLADTQAGAQDVKIIRNVNFASEAGYLRRIGASEHVIKSYLLARNGESSNPIDDGEIGTIAASISGCSPDQAMYEFMGGRTTVPSLVLGNGGSLESAIRGIQVESLMELEARISPQDLIPGILPDKSLIFVNAKPAAGKSLLLEAFAFSVALGLPLMGTGPIPTRTGWVLLLLSEGANSCGARSKRFRDHYGIPPTDQISVVTVGVEFTTPGRIVALIDAINKEIERRDGVIPTLIILDTLSASIPGLDENQQAAMTPVCSVLQSWATSGVTVIVAHHLQKHGGQPRGSSVIDGASERSLAVSNSSGLRKVTATKVRDGEFRPFAFEVIDHDGFPVPVMGSAPTFEFLIAATEEGLVNALVACGFNRVGGPPSGGFATGIDLNAILEAWKQKNPIEPERSVDRSSNDRKRNQRIKATIELMLALLKSRDIAIVSGKVLKSKRPESLKAVVRQVVGDEIE